MIPGGSPHALMTMWHFVSRYYPNENVQMLEDSLCSKTARCFSRLVITSLSNLIVNVGKLQKDNIKSPGSGLPGSAVNAAPSKPRSCVIFILIISKSVCLRWILRELLSDWLEQYNPEYYNKMALTVQHMLTSCPSLIVNGSTVI